MGRRSDVKKKAMVTLEKDYTMTLQEVSNGFKTI